MRRNATLYTVSRSSSRPSIQPGSDGCLSSQLVRVTETRYELFDELLQSALEEQPFPAGVHVVLGTTAGSVVVVARLEFPATGVGEVDAPMMSFFDLLVTDGRTDDR